MEENLAAADVVLSRDEIDDLNGLSARIDVQGGRYPDTLEAQTDL